MKIFFFVYRKWAFEIANNIKKKFSRHNITIFTLKKHELTNSEIKNNNVVVLSGKLSDRLNNFLKKKPNIIFYLGWSEIINKKIFQNFLCICLHPSKLPLFRGGSPLQHQIIRNINRSAITLFKMNEFIDGGPISHQISLSLNGDIPSIFNRIKIRGFLLISKFISDYEKNKIFYKKIKLSNYKIYKRRKISQSYLNFKSLKNKKFVNVNNFVRMLTGTYPNAFIKLNNYKIRILKIQRTNLSGPFLKKIDINNIKNVNGYIIQLKDCKIKILKSVIEYNS